MTPAGRMFLIALVISSLPLVTSKIRTMPSRRDSSERKMVMAAPEHQINLPCCCSNQNLKASRTEERVRKQLAVGTDKYCDHHALTKDEGKSVWEGPSGIEEEVELGSSHKGEEGRDR